MFWPGVWFLGVGGVAFWGGLEYLLRRRSDDQEARLNGAILACFGLALTGFGVAWLVAVLISMTAGTVLGVLVAVATVRMFTKD
jgi:CDP-diglyceride synthetase